MVAASPLNAGLPLTVGLPARQMSPGRVGAQMAVTLPSSWVQVEPWQTESQAILHSGDLCIPVCTWLLSHRSKGCGPLVGSHGDISSTEAPSFLMTLACV